MLTFLQDYILFRPDIYSNPAILNWISQFIKLSEENSEERMHAQKIYKLLQTQLTDEKIEALKIDFFSFLKRLEDKPQILNFYLIVLCDTSENVDRPKLKKVQLHFDTLMEQMNHSQRCIHQLLTKTTVRKIFAQQDARNYQHEVTRGIEILRDIIAQQTQSFMQGIIDFSLQERRRDQFLSVTASNSITAEPLHFTRPELLDNPIERVNLDVVGKINSILNKIQDKRNNKQNQKFSEKIEERLLSNKIHIGRAQDELTLINLRDEISKNPTDFHISIFKKIDELLFPIRENKRFIFSVSNFDNNSQTHPYIYELYKSICSAENSKLEYFEVRNRFTNFLDQHYDLGRHSFKIKESIEEIMRLQNNLNETNAVKENLEKLIESNKKAEEESLSAFNCYQAQLTEFKKLKKVVQTNNQALLHINQIQQFIDSYETVEEILNNSSSKIEPHPLEFSSINELVISLPIKNKLNELQYRYNECIEKIRSLDSLISAHNAAINVLEKLNLHADWLENSMGLFKQRHSNGSVDLSFLLSSLDPYKNAVAKSKDTLLLTTSSTINPTLQDKIDEARNKLLRIIKQAEEEINLAEQPIYDEFSKCIEKKIKFLQEQGNEINKIIKVRSIHKNRIAQKILKDSKDFINQICFMYDNLITNDRSEKFQFKLDCLSHIDTVIGENLLLIIKSINNNYNADNNRRRYEKCWGAIKKIILKMFSAYNESDHHPRCIRAKILLEETNRKFPTGHNNLNTTLFAPNVRRQSSNDEPQIFDSAQSRSRAT